MSISTFAFHFSLYRIGMFWTICKTDTCIFIYFVKTDFICFFYICLFKMHTLKSLMLHLTKFHHTKKEQISWTARANVKIIFTTDFGRIRNRNNPSKLSCPVCCIRSMCGAARRSVARPDRRYDKQRDQSKQHRDDERGNTGGHWLHLPRHCKKLLCIY